MQQRFHVYVRRYDNGWTAMSVLTHPRYAVIGTSPGQLRDQLHDTLARDLALEYLPAQEIFYEDLEVDKLDVTLSAVQLDRLVRVPMRFTLCIHGSEQTRWTVLVPRLDLTFTLKGRKYLEEWSTERIRGALHLASVRQLMAVRAARVERIDPLLVRWHGSSRYLAQVKGKKVSKVAELALSTRPALGGVGIDLVDEAKQGRLPRALSRSAEVDRLVETLSRGRQQAALVTGEPGVGKTAVVHEFCHRIAQGNVPRRLRDVPVWSVSGNSLMAGMKYLGQWQERALTIARTLQSTGGVLFVGGLLEFVDAGSGAGGLNAGQLFLPFLDRSAFPLVAETTPDGLVRAEQVHAGFVRALQRIDVSGMDRSTAFEVLQILARRMARPQSTTVTDEALSTALELLARYGNADALPGAGLSLLERMIKGQPRKTLDRTHAIAAFRESTGFPEVLVDPDRALDEEAVRTYFASRIVGQAEAVRVLTELVLVLKAGLADPGKPFGSFLLLGPTGVGKTESAKALANWLFGSDDRLVRLDMSEFAAHGSAQRLVQGPGGQGLLTRKVREQPFGVVLFDEIEKAEPGVYDVLLQALGEGRLTDGTGVTVSMRHTIVLLTSNLGASSRPRVGLAAESPEDAARGYRKAAEDFFRPEFVNRLDALVPYDALSPEAIRTIARGLLDEALSREGFTRREVTVRWGDDVLEHLMRKGYDPKLGARPMRRAIETEVLAPLSRVLARSVPEGTQLSLRVVHGGVEVE